MQLTVLVIYDITTVKLVGNKKKLPEVTHKRFGPHTTRPKKKKKVYPNSKKAYRT